MHPRWEAEPTRVRTEYSTVGKGVTAMTNQNMWMPRQYSLYSIVGRLEPVQTVCRGKGKLGKRD